jgi:hypothetical protein
MIDQLASLRRPRALLRPCLALLVLAAAKGESAAGLAENGVQQLKALGDL